MRLSSGYHIRKGLLVVYLDKTSDSVAHFLHYFFVHLGS